MPIPVESSTPAPVGTLDGRLRFPATDDRLAYEVHGPNLPIYAQSGKPVVIYSDAAGSVLADIVNNAGAAIAGSSLTVDNNSQIPEFFGPVGVEVLYARLNGGTAYPIYAWLQGRYNEHTAELAAINGGFSEHYPSMVNVAGYLTGPELDGTADASASLATAILDCAAQSQGWGNGGIDWEASGSTALWLPGDAILRIDTPISAPGGRPIILKSSPWGARLVNNTGGDWIIDQDGQGIGSVFEVDGPVFDGGGIRLATTSAMRGHIRIRNSLFVNTPSWMIDFGNGGTSTAVTNARIEYIMGYTCALGVRQAVTTAQLFEISHCRFYNMSGIALDLDTSDLRVNHIDFQGMLKSSVEPWVRIANVNDCIGVSLSNCRFGPESYTQAGIAYDQARTCVQIGGTGGTGAVTGLTLRDNLFLGNDDGPVVGSVADSAIQIKTAVFKGLKVEGGLADRSYGIAFIDEDWVDSTTSAPSGLARLRDVPFTNSFNAPLFSKGGVAWLTDRRDSQSEEPNLSVPFASYPVSGSTFVASGATDVPPGSIAYTLTKTGSGDGQVTRNITTTKSGPVTFSFLARKGTFNVVRVGLSYGGRFYTPNQESILLDSNWQLIVASIPLAIPAATVVTVRIFAGRQGDTNTGTIELAGPPVFVQAPHPGRPNVLRGSAVWNPASIATGASTSTTVTVTGAAVGDTVTASHSSLTVGGAVLHAQVTAVDTITVTLANLTGVALDLASGTLRVVVTKSV